MRERKERTRAVYSKYRPNPREYRQLGDYAGNEGAIAFVQPNHDRRNRWVWRFRHWKIGTVDFPRRKFKNIDLFEDYVKDFYFSKDDEGND